MSRHAPRQGPEANDRACPIWTETGECADYRKGSCTKGWHNKEDKGKKVEEGTHAELMKIDVVKGKPPKIPADDTEAAAKADEQKALVDAKADESGDATGGGEAGGQAKEAPADEEVTLAGFYHLMWDTQMVRLNSALNAIVRPCPSS